MGFKFWLFRATSVFTVIFFLLGIIYYFKGYETQEAILSAVIWSFISTSVFICTRLYHSKKGRSCAICNDTPEKPNSGS